MDDKFKQKILENYRASVQKRIRIGMPDIFENRDEAYTRIILEEFFNAAENTIRVFCGTFSSEVYSHISDSLLNALNRGVDIRIIAATEINTLESRTLADILISRDRLRQASNVSVPSPHFVLVDNKMFRIEKKQSTREAWVCACATKDPLLTHVVKDYEAQHNTMWNEATPYNLT